jgi:hypothetical protein
MSCRQSWSQTVWIRSHKCSMNQIGQLERSRSFQKAIGTVLMDQNTNQRQKLTVCC